MDTRIPEHLHYTKTHEWLKIEGNEALIGITHHAQELLGDLVFIELPEVGSHFDAGAEMGVVESVKAASDFYSPVAGQVIEINSHSTDEPACVNQEPYGHGWLVRIKMDNPDDAKHLLTAQDYQNACSEGH